MNCQRPVLPVLSALLLLLLVGGTTTPSLKAQQAGDDATFVAPRPVKREVQNAPVEKPAPLDITGIVAQAFNMKKPLRMVSPLAPESAGNGHDNVSWDPDKPEKPKGIILFGIQW